MQSLQEFMCESKTYSEFKREVLKTIGVSSWDKGNFKIGIFPKLGIQQISKSSAAAKKRGYVSPISYLANDDYNKLFITPNMSYMKGDEYNTKFLSHLDRLADIEGCSYQLINNNDEYKEILNINRDIHLSDNNFPMVIISAPKEGNKPELKEIPVKSENDKKSIEKSVENQNKLPNGVKGFWCTGAGSMSVDYIAYGAELEDWPKNLSRIQKHIGETKFTRYYTKLSTKKFSSYKALYNYLKKHYEQSKYVKYSKFSIADEDKIINSAKDESYYILTC